MSSIKVCIACGKSKSISSFYAHPDMPDGYINKCKKCHKAAMQRLRNAPSYRERMLERDKVRSKTAERKQYAIEAQRKRRAKYPEKAAARNAISNGLRDGKILRQPCKICGAKAQAHHDDYSKPFEVHWLCFKHHRELKHEQSVGSTAIEPWLIP